MERGGIDVIRKRYEAILMMWQLQVSCRCRRRRWVGGARGSIDGLVRGKYETYVGATVVLLRASPGDSMRLYPRVRSFSLMMKWSARRRASCLSHLAKSWSSQECHSLSVEVSNILATHGGGVLQKLRLQMYFLHTGIPL